MRFAGDLNQTLFRRHFIFCRYFIRARKCRARNETASLAMIGVGRLLGGGALYYNIISRFSWYVHDSIALAMLSSLIRLISFIFTKKIDESSPGSPSAII